MGFIHGNPICDDQPKDGSPITIDSSALVDINNVEINLSLPREERVVDFIRQIKNPYHYKCGDATIRISFIDTEATLEDRLENYLLSL